MTKKIYATQLIKWISLSNFVVFNSKIDQKKKLRRLNMQKKFALKREHIPTTMNQNQTNLIFS